MKKLFSALPIIMIFLYSCISDNKSGFDQDASSIKINLGDIIDKKIELNLSEIVSEIKYVQLETNKNCQISYVDKMVFTAKNIIILSKHDIFLFNHEGKFIRKIGAKGKGPNEYFIIRDISVDVKDKLIYGIDNESKKIIVYSFDGRFIKNIQIDLKGFLWQLAFLNNSKILIFRQYSWIDESGKNLQLYSIDNQGKVNWEFPVNNLKDLRVGHSNEASFLQHENYFEFASLWRDTIYRINESNNYESIYHFDFGKYRFPDDLFRDVEKYDKIKSNYIELMGEELLNDYIFIYYNLHDKFSFSIFDRKKNIFIYNENLYENWEAIPFAGIINDIDGGLSISNTNLKFAFNGNILLNPIQANEIRDILKDEYSDGKEILYPEKQNELIELAKSMDEDDNPVIQVLYLK